MGIPRRGLHLIVLCTLLSLVAIASVVGEAWLSEVGLPVQGYDGSGALIAIISTGVDLSNSTLRAAVVSVGGYACAVDIGPDGTVSMLQMPYDVAGIGTEQAKLVLQAAPRAKLLVVRVPYATDPSTGLPYIPREALIKALEWLRDPYIVLPNGTILECPVANYTAYIALLGLPVYSDGSGSQLDAAVADTLQNLTTRYLVVTPVGDAPPGILNQLALVEGVVSVAPLAAGEWRPGGLAAAFNATMPSSVYRDIPIEPDYVMPLDPAVQLTCSKEPTLTSLTCSEAAAAEYAGFAAIAAQMYYELRGSPPLPYKLELYIRSSVRDRGLPSKDTQYGWGVPDARVLHLTLLNNMGFEVCAPSYTKSGAAMLEVWVHGSDVGYGLVIRRGECVEAPAPVTPELGPDAAYELIVYGPPNIPPYETIVYTSPGYWKTILATPTAGALMSITGRVRDAKGVALRGELLVLPPDFSQVDARSFMLMLYTSPFEAGNIKTILSCDYLRLAYSGVEPYLLVRAAGYIARLYRLPLCEPPKMDLGVVTLAEAPKVLIVGRDPGVAIDAGILELLGFRVSVVESPEEAYASDADVVIIHPSAWEYAGVLYAQLRGEKSLVFEGAAAAAIGCAEASIAVQSTQVYLENLAFTPAYNPLIAARLHLYTLYPFNDARLYSIGGSLASGPGYERLVETSLGLEAYLNIASRVLCIANTWSWWREGRSLAASTPQAITLYAMLVSSISKTISVYVNGGRAADVHPLEELNVTITGWDLAVTLFDTSTGGLRRITSFNAPYPRYNASTVLTIGLLPAGEYTLIANDSLWHLGVGVYRVTPVLVPREDTVLAGGELNLQGMGFRANAKVEILIDGVSVGSTLTDQYGVFNATVPVPELLSPGIHTVAASDGLYTASTRIAVAVHKRLSVFVSLPQLVEAHKPVTGVVVVMLGTEYVDANITARVAGTYARVVRLSRGVYSIALPPLPPGIYNLIIYANAVQGLVNATGVAAASFTVVKAVEPATPADVEKAAEEIRGEIRGVSEEILKRLKGVEDRIDSLGSSVESLKRSINQSCIELKGEIRGVTVKIDNVRVSLLNEIRRVYAEVSAMYSRLSDAMGRIASDVSTTAKKLVEQVRGDIAAAQGRVSREISALNETLTAKILEVRGAIYSTSIYAIVALLMLGFDTAAVALILFRVLRK